MFCPIHAGGEKHRGRVGTRTLGDLGVEKRRIAPGRGPANLDQPVAAHQLRLRIVAQAARLVVVDVRERRALRQDLEQLVHLLLVLRDGMRDRRVLDRERHFGRHRVLVERHRDAAQALRSAHRGIDARPVVADQGQVVAALEALRGQAAGERAHFVGEARPAPGLPDTQILLANRRPPGAHARVVHQQLRKRIQPGKTFRHSALLRDRADCKAASIGRRKATSGCSCGARHPPAVRHVAQCCSCTARRWLRSRPSTCRSRDGPIPR